MEKILKCIVIFVLLCVRNDTKILKKEVLIYNFYKKNNYICNRILTIKKYNDMKYKKHLKNLAARIAFWQNNLSKDPGFQKPGSNKS